MNIINFDPKRRRSKRKARSYRPKRKGGIWSKVGIVIGAAAVIYGIANPVKRFPEHVPWLVELTSTRTITGPVTHVRDGDTIEVKGVPIRFSSLDCPELATDEGRAAKAGMQVLVAGHEVSCHLSGGKSYDREIASCWRDDGKELGAAMMRAGFCRRYW